MPQIIENYSWKNTNFVPIVGYHTNGGLVQKRLHYSNTFNPDLKTPYSSNYLFQKKNDIVIQGVINPGMIDTNEALSLNNFNDEIDEQMIISNLLHKSSKLTPKYEEIKKEYEYDLNKLIVTDTNILNQCLNNTEKNSLFTLENIIIDCPIKLSLYTILGNPARTIAIFIHNKEPGNHQEHYLNANFMNAYDPLEKKENLDHLLNKVKSSFFPIKINDNQRNLVIEFDTQEQFLRNPSEMQLLALIVLKDYSKPHLISLKKYYHLGKFISLKLIDQSTMFDYKKAGIDIGSILFYGEIFNFKKA